MLKMALVQKIVNKKIKKSFLLKTQTKLIALQW